MAKDRYVSFGEQMGIIAPRLALSLHDVPDAFRIGLWNLIEPKLRDQMIPGNFLTEMARDVGTDASHFYTMPGGTCKQLIRELITDGTWYTFYDLILNFARWGSIRPPETWEREANDFLELWLSPYRFVNHRLVAITSAEELESATVAATQGGKYVLSAQSYSKALEKFSLRPKPDYENAIKEAVSAMESALKIATGETEVGSATRTFSKKYNVHPALMESANKLFGYASDRKFVRHGPTEDGDPVEFAEAKVAIVTASAWINFVAAVAP